MKKIKLLFLSIIITVVLLFSNNVLAQHNIPEPTKGFYVYDESNIIDSKLEEYIVKTNERLYKKTGAQVVVVTVENLNDMDLKEYANRVFEKWEIGSKEYDNGVLFLIAPNKRELWIEIGYGLEGILPDGKVGRIRDEDIVPYFKDENYSEGILRGFNSILNAIEDEYDIDLEREEISENYYYHYNDSNSSKTFNIFDGFMRLLIIISIIIFIFIDFKFFNGCITYSILRNIRFSGRGFDDDHNKGGGGSSGGGGAGGKW